MTFVVIKLSDSVVLYLLPTGTVSRDVPVSVEKSLVPIARKTP